MDQFQLKKIYILSDHNGMKFIYSFCLDNNNMKDAGVISDVSLFKLLNKISLPHIESFEIIKVNYLNNRLNNHKIVDGVYIGLIEVPESIINYIKGNQKLNNDCLYFPFTTLYRYEMCQPVDRDCLVRMPNMSDYRDWKIDEIIE